MSLSVPHDWIKNHMRIASKLAMTIEAFARQQKLEVFELIEKLDAAQWKRFARLGCCSDDREYVPSSETRLMVAEFIRDDRQALCVECGLAQATRQDRAEAIEGDEVCIRCWNAAYVLDLNRDDPPKPPLPANVTPLRRVQHVEKRGPWAQRTPSSTNQNKE